MALREAPQIKVALAEDLIEVLFEVLGAKILPRPVSLKVGVACTEPTKFGRGVDVGLLPYLKVEPKSLETSVKLLKKVGAVLLVQGAEAQRGPGRMPDSGVEGGELREGAGAATI
jgi:hypothetical protein